MATASLLKNPNDSEVYTKAFNSFCRAAYGKQFEVWEHAEDIRKVGENYYPHAEHVRDLVSKAPHIWKSLQLPEVLYLEEGYVKDSGTLYGFFTKGILPISFSEVAPPVSYALKEPLPINNNDELLSDVYEIALNTMFAEVIKSHPGVSLQSIVAQLEASVLAAIETDISEYSSTKNYKNTSRLFIKGIVLAIDRFKKDDHLNSNEMLMLNKQLGVNYKKIGEI